ncbi:hypothetical protein CEXT_114141 [Caerostris extrusa]|uniref:Uncharacterized protein n=1 Tax=Caerostris extrusa TaxID=172846 RepID=A0AAV4RH18_CAEEX|nr:hypothetical protein CEXT_114141 [Caerostris extrusa]
MAPASMLSILQLASSRRHALFKNDLRRDTWCSIYIFRLNNIDNRLTALIRHRGVKNIYRLVEREVLCLSSTARQAGVVKRHK